MQNNIEYRVVSIYVGSIDSFYMQENINKSDATRLTDMLNEGWQIYRSDPTSNNVTYVLYRVKDHD